MSTTFGVISDRAGTFDSGSNNFKGPDGRYHKVLAVSDDCAQLPSTEKLSQGGCSVVPIRKVQYNTRGQARVYYESATV